MAKKAQMFIGEQLVLALAFVCCNYLLYKKDINEK